MDPLLSCLVFTSCLHSVSTQAKCTEDLQLNFSLSNEPLRHRNMIIYILKRSQFIVLVVREIAHLHVKDSAGSLTSSIKWSRTNRVLLSSIRNYIKPQKWNQKTTWNWHRITDSIRFDERRIERVKRIVSQRTDESSNVAKACSGPIVWESNSYLIEGQHERARETFHHDSWSPSVERLSTLCFFVIFRFTYRSCMACRKIMIRNALCIDAFIEKLPSHHRPISSSQLIVSFPERDRCAFFTFQGLTFEICCVSNVQVMVLREHGNFKMSPWILPVPLPNTKEFLSLLNNHLRLSPSILFAKQ